MRVCGRRDRCLATPTMVRHISAPRIYAPAVFEKPVAAINILVVNM